jgi:outer membrane protein assembly factor BamB
MLSEGKPQHRRWFPRAGTAALALLFLFVLSTLPVRAEQGVAVGPYWQVEVEGDLMALAVNDLDGDGWAEIVTGTDEGQVTLWRAEGEPAWTFEVETNWVTGLSTGDLEGDGTKEVFVTAAGILPTNYLYVLRADGQLLWSHVVRDELWGVYLLDLDGDGRQEVLLAAQRPVVLDDYGSELAGWPVDPLRTPFVYVADLDGSGTDEVTAIGETDVTILEADGTRRAWPHSLAGPIIAAQTADLDGDGLGEIVIATEETVAVFHEDGRPSWAHPVGEPPTTVRAEDGLGVLVASKGAVVRLMLGSGEAWRFVGPSTPSAAPSLDVAQTGADGAPRTVLGTFSGQAYLLDASGNPLAEYPVSGAVNLVRYADLNGDGRGEVLVGSGDVLSVFGSPAGATTTRLRWTYATRGAVTVLAAGDVDGDGQREVAVGGRDKKVTLLDKEGAMVWQFPAADVVDGLSASGWGEILVRAGSDLYLLAGDGRLLWQRPFPSRPVAASWARASVAGIVVGLEDGQVKLLDPRDGADQWSRTFDQAVQAVGVSERLAGTFVGLGDGRVIRLDGQGHLLWEQDTGRFVSSLAVADIDHDGHAPVTTSSAYRLGMGL